MKLVNNAHTRQSGIISAESYPMGGGAPFYEGQAAGTTTVNCYRLTAILKVTVPLVIDGLWFDIPYADDYSARLVAGISTSTTTVVYTLSTAASKSTGSQFFQLDEARILLLPQISYYLQVNCANQRTYKGADAAFLGTYYSITSTYYNTTTWGKWLPVYIRGYVLADSVFPLNYAETA